MNARAGRLLHTEQSHHFDTRKLTIKNTFLNNVISYNANSIFACKLTFRHLLIIKFFFQVAWYPHYIFTKLKYMPLDDF